MFEIKLDMLQVCFALKGCTRYDTQRRGEGGGGGRGYIHVAVTQ